MNMHRSKTHCAALLLCCCAASFAQTPDARQTTASAYLARGNDWLAKHEVERALADFDLAIASAPDFAACLKLNPRLRADLEQQIRQARRQ